MSEAENRTVRIFKTGSTLIQEDDSMRALSNEAVRDLLRNQYPELANATLREIPQPKQEGEPETLVIEFLPQPGRKG